MGKYMILKDVVGSGNFGVTKILSYKWSDKVFAVLYIVRAEKVGAFFLFLTPFLSSLNFISVRVYSSKGVFIDFLIRTQIRLFQSCSVVAIIYLTNRLCFQ